MSTQSHLLNAPVVNDGDGFREASPITCPYERSLGGAMVRAWRLWSDEGRQ